MADVRWAKYGSFSGPWVRGTKPYTPPSREEATWWDVLCYAVASPEGGAYDTFVAYDGTAVTAGLFQWTFTSGRLQKMLVAAQRVAPKTFQNTVGALFSSMGITFKNGVLFKDEKALTDKASLRDLFTPPGGQTPKSGSNWNKARAVAEAFNTFFRDPMLNPVQENFFLTELISESKLGRPKMGGRSIASILYPKGWDPDGLPPHNPQDACRAMFWSFWQNAPRQAELYLGQVADVVSFDKDAHSFMIRLARKFAHSTFGNWGLEKAAQNKRESRYSKIVKCVNALMGPDTHTLPNNP